MRDLIEGLLESYSARVETVTALIGQTAEILKQAEQEQEAMAQELRELLAKERSLRRKDFDRMMETIRTQRRRREQEMTQMVESFQRDEEAMVEELRGILSGGKAVSAETFRALGEDILQRQRARESEVGRLLRAFHLEQEELAAGLKKLLAKGDGVRVQDFKAMVKGFVASQTYQESHLAQVQEVFERVRREVDIAWHHVMATDYQAGGLTARPLAEETRSGIHQRKEV